MNNDECPFLLESHSVRTIKCGLIVTPSTPSSSSGVGVRNKLAGIPTRRLCSDSEFFRPSWRHSLGAPIRPAVTRMDWNLPLSSAVSVAKHPTSTHNPKDLLGYSYSGRVRLMYVCTCSEIHHVILPENPAESRSVVWWTALST